MLGRVAGVGKASPITCPQNRPHFILDLVVHLNSRARILGVTLTSLAPSPLYLGKHHVLAIGCLSFVRLSPSSTPNTI